MMRNANSMQRISRISRALVLAAALTVLVGAAVFFYDLRSSGGEVEDVAAHIARACDGSSANQVGHEKCLAHQLALVGEQRGFGFMGDVLSLYQGATISQDYQDYQNCHVLSHRVSNELADWYEGSWEELVEKMGGDGLDLTRCGGGFLHGVIEVEQGRNPHFTIDAGLYTDLCRNTLSQELSTSCAHILGHLLLVQEKGDTDEALAGCDGLARDFKFQCAGGIFMEDSMRTNLAAHGLSSEPAKTLSWFTTQHERCKRYGRTGEIVDGCWYDMPEVYAQAHSYDLKGTYAFCLTAPNLTARTECYIRASYLIALMPDPLFNPSDTELLCSLYAPGDSSLRRCMENVLGATLGSSLGYMDRMVAFCGNWSGAAGDTCYRIIGRYIGSSRVSEAQKEALCTQLPEQDRSSCASTGKASEGAAAGKS